MKTYIIKCECTKIVNAESLEDAEVQVVDELTLGYGCESAEVKDSDIVD